MSPMKRIPPTLATILILALATLNSINLAFASSPRSPKVLPPVTVSNFADKSLSEPVPEPTPPAHATKDDIKNDLDDLKLQYQKLIDDHPDGLVSTLITEAGFTPGADIDEAKDEVDAISQTDFDAKQKQWDKAHNGLKKHKNQVAELLNNKPLMAMLNRPFPGKLHIVVTSSGAPAAPRVEKTRFGSAKNIDRAFPAVKNGSARTAFTKDLGRLTVTVVPELTGTCTPGDGIPLGIDGLFIAKGVALGLEIAKEAIPDDTATVVPHLIAVTGWGVAKSIELALDLLHAHYLECNAKRDGDALTAGLGTINTINTTAGSIKTTLTGVNTTVTGINTTVTGINTKIDTLSTKADTTNNTVNTVNGNVTTINNNVNNLNTKVDNVNTNIDNSRTLIINNNLRLLIEADLATPDSSTPLALFETPAAKGGHLEMVRLIVFETIQNLTGATAAQANATLASVDALIVAGKYKAAYAALRKAYKTAAN